MTYAIGQIVFGIDLQVPSPYSSPPMGDNFAEFRDELEELTDISIGHITGVRYHELITRQYSGGGEPPMYFGINLGQIDECSTTLGTDLMKMLTVTDEQKAQYQQMLDMLKDEATPALFDKINSLEPYVFLTWGSS